MTRFIVTAIILVGAGLLLSRILKLGIERDFFLGAIRAAVQLTLAGSLIHLVFELESFLIVLITLILMVAMAGYTAGKRSGGIPGSFYFSSISIGAGSFFSLALVLASGIVEPVPMHMIPFGGIIIGSAMKASAVALDLTGKQFREKIEIIETALSLGATPWQASEGVLKDSIRTALIPTLDTLKIVGMIQIPGAMTGMILAGQSPLSAVRFQLLILFMLVTSGIISSAASMGFAYRELFTPAGQLVRFPRR